MCEEINKLHPQDRIDKYFEKICIKYYRRFLQYEGSFDLNQKNTLWKLCEDILQVEQIWHFLDHSDSEIEKHRA